MNDQHAADILARHNEWRRYRGETGVEGAPVMGDPTEIGIAIDHVVKRILGMIASPPRPASGGEPVAWRVLWTQAFPETAELTSDGGRIGKLQALDNPPHIEPLYTAPPSAPVVVEAVDAAAWTEALELPEGFRVAEHLPGIWEYQFDIADADDDDSDRMCSSASWNHPALAAIAAWQHAYDKALAQQPDTVGDVLIPRELAERVRDALGRFTGDEGWAMEDMETADDLSAAIDQQPAARASAARGQFERPTNGRLGVLTRVLDLGTLDAWDGHRVRPLRLRGRL